MIINQISIFLENKTGQLKEVMSILAKDNIDLRAINVAEAQEYGVIRIIVDDYELACKTLKEHEYVYRTTPVVVVALKDEVGGLSKLLDAIDEGEFNIEYMYSIFSQIENRALMVFKVDDAEKLEKLLISKGYNSVDMGIK